MSTPWIQPVSAVLVLWIVVAVACVPLLGVGAVRKLLDCWPTDRPKLNYLVLSGGVVLGHAAVFFAGVVVTGGFSGTALVQWTFLVAGGYPVALWVLGGGIAVGTGHWTSLRAEFDQWLALGGVALWYAVVIAVAAAIVFIILFGLYFPG